jgi:transcription elongation factor Elf1
MTTLDEIGEQLQDMTCPRCRQHPGLLSVVNLKSDERQYVMRCLRCSHEFPITGAYLAAMEAARARLAAGLAEACCPHCDIPDFRFVFRCDLRDGSCFFLAHCRTCGYVFRVIDHQTHLELVAFGYFEG